MTSEDDDAIRKAFEQFMLSGSSNNTSEKNTPEKKNTLFSPKKINWCKTPPPHTTLNQESPSRQSYDKQHSPARIEKKYWHSFKRFCSTIQNDWISVDDQLEDIIHSLMNIRLRIPMEYKMLQKLEKGSHVTDSFAVGYLNTDDVNLALSHDLLQHERMMAALRRLLSDLSETNDYLGRQLNDAMSFHLSSSGNDASMTNALALIDDMNRVYLMLSNELCRKQILAMNLSESVDDCLLLASADDVGVFDGGDETRRGIDDVSLVAKEWPRNCKKSCIDGTYFDYVMSKGIS